MFLGDRQVVGREIHVDPEDCLAASKTAETYKGLRRRDASGKFSFDETSDLPVTPSPEPTKL